MVGLRLRDLPLPSVDLDAELAPLDTRGRPRFESAAAVADEDRKRAMLLRRQGRKITPLFSARRAQRLTKRLTSDRSRRTPASARHMHDMRRRIVGAVWKLVCDEKRRTHVVTATLIPRGLEVRPADLDNWTSAAILNRLRSQITRAEAIATEAGNLRGAKRGWLLAGMHCEFDPTGQLYQFHYHALASGHMIRVLDSLRAKPLYRRKTRDRVRDRVRMSRKPLNNLPAPLGYPWQLFWPNRARGDGSDDGIGFNQLNRRKRRLPEPYHTQMLLWLDRQQIEEMTLMIGLRVGRGGLEKTYTDEEGCTSARP